MKGTSSAIPNELKTPMMKWIELRENEKIEVLMEGTVREVADRLKMSRRTVIRWRKRLNLGRTYPPSPSTTTCEYCGNTVTNIKNHIETCEWAEEYRLGELFFGGDV